MYETDRASSEYRQTVRCLCGYPAYRLEGGAGGRVSFTYAERCVNEKDPARRDDWKNGEITGLTDRILVCYDSRIGEKRAGRSAWILGICGLAGGMERYGGDACHADKRSLHTHQSDVCVCVAVRGADL